jgi:hypothetical protein
MNRAAWSSPQWHRIRRGAVVSARHRIGSTAVSWGRSRQGPVMRDCKKAAAGGMQYNTELFAENGRFI